MSVCLCVFVYLCLSVCWSVCLPACLSVSWSVCLSICAVPLLKAFLKVRDVPLVLWKRLKEESFANVQLLETIFITKIMCTGSTKWQWVPKQWIGLLHRLFFRGTAHIYVVLSNILCGSGFRGCHQIYIEKTLVNFFSVKPCLCSGVWTWKLCLYLYLSKKQNFKKIYLFNKHL